MIGNQRGGIIFRFLTLLVFLAFLGCVYLIRHPLLRLAGDFWVVQDPVEHADAIVVLGDDNYAGDRASRAAELFRAGWAPEVVASGRMLRPYFGVAELIQRDLESRGVPASAVVRLDHNADNTREEAQALLGLARRRHWHRLLVVTSNFHTRRARYIFRRIFPPDLSIAMVAVSDARFDPGNWWKTREGRKVFFLETVSYCVARWELWKRAGAAAQPPTPAETPALPPRQAAPGSPAGGTGGRAVHSR